MKVSMISLLLKRQFSENSKIYGIGVFVLLALLLFMFLIVHQWQDSFAGAVQNGVFIIGLFLAGGIFSNSMFHEFSTPQSGIWLLSIPAKDTEKVISSIIMSVPIFLLIYFSVFYLADVLYLAITDKLVFDTILNPFKNNFYQFIFWYMLFNGIILLGSIVFNRHSLIKTILATVLLFIVFNYINTLLLEFFIPDISVISSTAFDSFLFSYQGENINVMLLDTADTVSAIFVWAVLPLSIWFAVWLKLKEKEI